jgi:hypothetical protein
LLERRLRSRPVRVTDETLIGLYRTERGTEARFGEWEPEPRLVRPEVLSEEISPALKDIKAAG